MVVAESRVEPSIDGSALSREFVYGVGELLVERITGMIQVSGFSASSPLEDSGVYSFDISSAPAGAVYDLRIETTNGYLNNILGVTPDASGKITVGESEFSAGETNFLRVRRVEPTESPWSGAVSLHVDESVTSSSDNQVRAVSADRTGNDITIRWDLLQDNGKAFNVYARRSDGMATYLLSPGGLDPSARSLVLSAQALSSPCVEFYLKQLTPNTPPVPPTESAASAGALFHAVIETPGEGCPGIGSPPTPGPDQFVNRFHHRDHLGTLRLVTSDSGTAVEALDFYPFGMEMAFSEIGGSSSRKYTGHERDEETGLDYMLARYKGVADGAFASPDPSGDVSSGAPSSWNSFSYVSGNPISYSDPSGLSKVGGPFHRDPQGADLFMLWGTSWEGSPAHAAGSPFLGAHEGSLSYMFDFVTSGTESPDGTIYTCTQVCIQSGSKSFCFAPRCRIAYSPVGGKDPSGGTGYPGDPFGKDSEVIRLLACLFARSGKTTGHENAELSAWGYIQDGTFNLSEKLWKPVSGGAAHWMGRARDIPQVLVLQAHTHNGPGIRPEPSYNTGGFDDYSMAAYGHVPVYVLSNNAIWRITEDPLKYGTNPVEVMRGEWWQHFVREGACP